MKALKLPKVDGSLGAPMGRTSTALPDGPTKIHFVRLDKGGYDNGFSYWGIGLPLYCLTDGKGYQKFLRAKNKREAAKKFGELGLKEE